MHISTTEDIFYYWKLDVNQIKCPINYGLTFEQMFLVLPFTIIVFIFSVWFHFLCASFLWPRAFHTRNATLDLSTDHWNFSFKSCTVIIFKTRTNTALCYFGEHINIQTPAIGPKYFLFSVVCHGAKKGVDRPISHSTNLCVHHKENV